MRYALVILMVLIVQPSVSWCGQLAQKNPQFRFIIGRNYAESDEMVERIRQQLEQLSDVGIEQASLQGGRLTLKVFVYAQKRIPSEEVQARALAALPCQIEGLPVYMKLRFGVVLPPPPGVVVLLSREQYESADSCPKGFVEIQKYGWRFCDPHRPKPLPPLWEPPIVGKPYKEVSAIFRHSRAELSRLSGVQSVRLGDHGIIVRTSQPNLIPDSFKDIPIHTKKVSEEENANHFIIGGDPVPFSPVCSTPGERG